MTASNFDLLAGKRSTFLDPSANGQLLQKVSIGSVRASLDAVSYENNEFSVLRGGL